MCFQYYVSAFEVHYLSNTIDMLYKRENLAPNSAFVTFPQMKCYIRNIQGYLDYLMFWNVHTS